MRRIFKTRYFIRWMRKTALNDEVLCATRVIAGFLCTVLKKMTVPTYPTMNWKL